MSKETKELIKQVDIIGKSLTSRHICRNTIKKHPHSNIRLWAKPIDEKKIVIVPPDFRSHMGLNYRITAPREPVVFYPQRKREELKDSAQFSNLAVKHLIKHLVYSNYFPTSLFTQKGIAKINYDWENEALIRPLVKTENLVFATQSSIDRIWLQNLLKSSSNLQVESKKTINRVEVYSGKKIKLTLSAPHEPVFSDHLIDCRQNDFDSLFKWKWHSYSTNLASELVASVPNFFIIINGAVGEDFLDSGILKDGAICRGFCTEEPDDKSKAYLQIDRLTNIQIPPKDFLPVFQNTHLNFLDKEKWSEIEPTTDDYVYEQALLNSLAKKIVNPYESAQTKYVTNPCNTHSIVTSI